MNKISVELIEHSSLSLVQTLCTVTRGANKFASAGDLLQSVHTNSWSNDKLVQTLSLPHSKLSRFIDFTFIIAGTSRRFLAQLTTHHIGISIMSGSLQYSDWSKVALEDKFVVPYNLLHKPELRKTYLEHEESDMQLYNEIAASLGNDTAGYCTPESLRNIMVVKVNLEELRFIGNQRLCKRNTDETRYVVALMISKVCHTMNIPSSLFMPNCVNGDCKEEKYSCRVPILAKTVNDYLVDEFPKLYTFDGIRYARKNN